MAITVAAATIISGLIGAATTGAGGFMNMNAQKDANRANMMLNNRMISNQKVNDFFGRRLQQDAFDEGVRQFNARFGANEDQRGIDNLAALRQEMKQMLSSNVQLKNRLKELWST